MACPLRKKKRATRASAGWQKGRGKGIPAWTWGKEKGASVSANAEKKRKAAHRDRPMAPEERSETGVTQPVHQRGEGNPQRKKSQRKKGGCGPLG